MEDTQTTFYTLRVIILIGLTLGFFSHFSKKVYTLGSLIFYVLVPTWIIIALLTGIEYLYLGTSKDLFSILGIVLLLVETLPMMIVIGGITFSIKYLKFRKNRT